MNFLHLGKGPTHKTRERRKNSFQRGVKTMVNQDFDKFKKIQDQHPSIYLGNSEQETKRNKTGHAEEDKKTNRD